MKFINVFFIFCFLASEFCANILYAQNQPKFISLSDALQMAEKNYPLLKAKDWEVKAAQENLSATKEGVFIPSLKLHEQIDYATANSVQGTYFSDGISTSGGIGATNNFMPVYGSVSLGLLEWVPYSFGQNKSRIELSKIELKNSMMDAANEKFLHQILVTNAYLTLVALHQLSSVAKTNFERVTTIKIATTALAKSGLRPGVDSSFANSELSKATLDFYEEQKNETTQKIILSNLIGEQNSSFTFDTLTFLTKEPSIQNDTAISSLPLVLLYQSRIDLSRAKEKYINRSYFPKVSFLGGAWGRGSGMGISAGTISDASLSGGTQLTGFNYALGIACTFNILDYPRVHSQYLSQQAETSAQTEEYNQITQNARSGIAAANAQIEFARKQKQETPIQFNAATDAFNQSKARYESGLATLTEVQQSLYLLNQAATDKVIANNNLWRAFLQKAASTGNFSEFLNQIK